MRSLSLSAAAAMIGCLFGIATATAQPQPAPITAQPQPVPSYTQTLPPPSYEQVKEACRHRGEYDQALSGDALSRFVEQCIAQAPTAGTEVAVPIPTWEQKQAMCRQEGETRQGLTGSQLTEFVDLCLAQGGATVGSGTSTPPATATDDPSAVKLQACRDDGATRQGLSGDMLQAFVAKCVNE